ncbi:unnamed protein product [Brassica oleracea var. botrytis]
MAGGGTTLEYTPTWVVALVCSVIVSISFAVERGLHRAGKHFDKNDQKQLSGALQKVKEELMLLGFISLLLSVSQSRIAKICISKELSEKLLPCKKPKEDKSLNDNSHFQLSFTGRHLLAGDSAAGDYCSQKGKAPLMSISALHELHIFIFVLAIAHIIFCLLTILFGTMKIMQWRKWEDKVLEKDYNADEVIQKKYTAVREHDFIRGRFLGVGKADACFGWVHSFMKQFLASVNESDYITMRLGFVTTHCKTNPKFNFHKYLIRALNSDFKKVVGISWYLWVFVVLFLLLNIAAWHVYFWLAFLPLILLLAVGMKLEHIITDLAHEVAEKHIAVEGDLVVRPSDDLFWFKSPRLVLFLIHFILFQNSFELAFIFFIFAQYGFDSCIMGQVKFIIPRLVIGVLVQLLCSYSTLPLYALVAQMGSSFKGTIFTDQAQKQIAGWAKSAKMAKKKGSTHAGSSHGGIPNPIAAPSPKSIQLQSLLVKGSSQQSHLSEKKPEIILKAAGERSGGSFKGVEFLLKSDFLEDPVATYSAADTIANSEDESVPLELKTFLQEHCSEAAFKQGVKESIDNFMNFMRVLKIGESGICLKDLPAPLKVAIAYMPLYRECVKAGGRLLSQKLRGQLVEAVKQLQGFDVETEGVYKGHHQVMAVLEHHLPIFLVKGSSH